MSRWGWPRYVDQPGADGDNVAWRMNACLLVFSGAPGSPSHFRKPRAPFALRHIPWQV